MLVLVLAIVPLLMIPLVFDLSPGAETTIITLDWFILGSLRICQGWGISVRTFGEPR